LAQRKRTFVREKIKPNIRERWEKAIFPREIVLEIGAQGLLGIAPQRVRVRRKELCCLRDRLYGA
jgi:alkylation response protein AidB-like acyl-CoA dehydrogenase